MVRLTHLHGTEQVQEQGDPVQRVADELLHEAAQRNSCFKRGSVFEQSWENVIVKLISLLSVLSNDFNDRHLETGKKCLSGSVHSWLVCRKPKVKGQLWPLGDMDQARKVCTAGFSAGNRRSEVKCGCWGTWTRPENPRKGDR